MNWYLEALKKYAVFQGRARRKEYWYFTLFNTIIYFLLNILDMAVLFELTMELGFALFTMTYGVAVILPTLAVAVRRLHDTGRSGWWLLIGLVPVVGAIVLIVFFVQDSEPGENQFGKNPKEESV